MRVSVVFVVVVASAVCAAANPPAPVCWKNTHDRGVGKVPDSCPSGHEKNGALCYPDCKDGYYGVGPVCWQHCPSGWVDEGALCREDGSIKTIAKKSYGRGAGKVMVCGPDAPDEDAGLCYPKCPSTMSGVGPVCWWNCAAPDPSGCGAICASNSTFCDNKVKQLVGGLPLAVAEAILAGKNVTGIIEAAEQALDSILGFIMPLCDTLSVSSVPKTYANKPVPLALQ